MNARSHADRHEPIGWAMHDSPLGKLTVGSGPDGLVRVQFGGRVPGEASSLPEGASPQPDALAGAIAQLDRYFAADVTRFDLALHLRGSDFQVAVWEQLLRIPYGTTTTYGAIAAAIDPALYAPEVEDYMRPRAVGAAVGSNPIAIVVPCHRVIGADGSLTGYRGGLWRKRALLELEGAAVVAPRARHGGAPDAQLALLSDVPG